MAESRRDASAYVAEKVRGHDSFKEVYFKKARQGEVEKKKKNISGHQKWPVINFVVVALMAY